MKMHKLPIWPKTFSFPSIILAIFLTLQTSSYHITGNIIYDLEDNTSQAALTAEAAPWYLSLYRVAGVKVSYCNGYYLVGGYCVLGGSGGEFGVGPPWYDGQYFRRTYTPPVAHNQILLQMSVYTIDSWDGLEIDDHFSIAIDGDERYAWRIQGFHPVYSNTNLCGASNWNDFPPFTMYLSYPHTSMASFEFKIINHCDEDSCNESIGFRDIKIEFTTSPSPTFNLCARGGAPMPSGPCPCLDPNTFMSPPNSGTCISCYTTCATCIGANYNQCTSCYPGNYLSGGQCFACNGNCKTCTGTSTTCTSCNSGLLLIGTQCFSCDGNCATCIGTPTTCTSCHTGWFLVTNKCYPTCTSPLYPSVSNGVTYCNTPCPGQVVFWDSSCGPACSYTSNAAGGSFGISGSIESTFSRCDHPCQSSAPVLYWNGTCGNNCPAPLTATTFHSRTFCDYSCGSTQFLYWNGSCLNNCPSPLSLETQGSVLPRQFCWYNCQPNQFLYWNGSCLGNCPSPLSSETQGSFLPRQFCWYTCMPWQWLYWDQTCQESCGFPVWPETQGTYLQRQFCWYPCTSESRFLYWNGTCLPECPEPLSTRYQNGQWFCDYPCLLSAEFLYWNGSCINNCISPLISKIEGSPARKFCYYPCPPEYYIYWDDSCEPTCNFPLIPIFEGNPIRQKCFHPCNDNYLYWNGTCSTQCDPLFSPRTTKGRRFCDFPCLANEYLYWNGSCLNTCPFPLLAEFQGDELLRSFCNYPCSTSQFLYWNGSCLDNCPYPLSNEIQGITPSNQRRFCWFPCQPSIHLYWNGSCLRDCPSPLTSELQGIYRQRKFCWYSCQPDKYLYWNGTCLDQCPLPLLAKIEGTRDIQRLFCKYPCFESEWLYWDQTCQESCDFPLWSEVQSTVSRNFCWYPCQTNEFLYWNGTCLSQCLDPLKQRYQNQRWFCDYPCQNHEYLYWNGSCIDNCLIPLTPRLEGSPTNKFCDYMCLPDKYLYWDGTCQSTCNLPLLIHTEGTPTRQFCIYKCQANQYLYWNGTCSHRCNDPLSIKTLGNRYFCTYGCTLDTKYLFANGSCLDNCPFGFFKNDELRYCQACQDPLCEVCDTSFGTKCESCNGQSILDSNNICQDCQEVQSEYVKYIDPNKYQYKLRLYPSQKCDLDETTFRKYFNPTENSISSFPSFTFQVNQTQDFTGKFFLLEIDFEASIPKTSSNLEFTLSYLHINLSISKPSISGQQANLAPPELKTSLAAISGSTLMAALYMGATAALWSIISFQQFINYFLYMNIQFPSHLEAFLTMFDSADLEILPNPLEVFQNQLSERWDSVVNYHDHQEKYQLPNKFAYFDTPTLFVVNAGSSFLTCVFLMILPRFFDHLRKFRDLQNIKLFKETHSGLRWNIPIRVFLESGSPMLFSFLIQMRKISYANIPYAISTAAASLAFIYMCYMLNYISQTLINFDVKTYKDPHIEESIGTLFEGLVLKKEKPMAKYFYLLTLLRGMLIVFVDVYVDFLPVVQISSMAVFNLFFAYYNWKYVEFDSRYLTWTNRTKEIMILIAEVFMIILCGQSIPNGFRDIAGWLIIGMFTSILVLDLAYGVYLQILAVKEVFDKIRGYCKKRKEKKTVVEQEEEEQQLETPCESSRNVLAIEV